MIYHEKWESNYHELIEEIFDMIEPDQIAWISLGTLRFPTRQGRVMKQRFPKHQQIHEGLQHTHLPFLVYNEERRKVMIEKVMASIQKKGPSIKIYCCMETGFDARKKGS